MPVKRLNVGMVGQGSNPVCWMACAIMILRYNRGESLDPLPFGFEDPNITSFIGSVQSLNQFNVLRSLGFILKRSNEIVVRTARTTRQPHRANGFSPTTTRAVPRGFHTTPSVNRQYTLTEKIFYILNTLGPFVLAHHCGTFTYGHSGSTCASYHAVVITGIDTDRGVIYFNNPWGITDEESSVHRDAQTSIASIEGAIRRWEADSSGPTFYYLPG